MSITILEILSIPLISFEIFITIFILIRDNEKRIAKFLFVNTLFLLAITSYSIYIRLKFSLNKDYNTQQSTVYSNYSEKLLVYHFPPFEVKNISVNPNPSQFSFMHIYVKFDSLGNVVELPKVLFTGLNIGKLNSTVTKQNTNNKDQTMSTFTCVLFDKSFFMTAVKLFTFSMNKEGKILLLNNE